MNKIIFRSIGAALNVSALISPKFATKKGFQLFCTPFKPKLRPAQQAFFESAHKEKFKGEDIPEINLYKWGNGSKKILLVHGWSSHTFRWIKYIIELQKLDYTIYAFDGPAHGHSGGKIMNVPLYEMVFSEFTKQYGSMDFYVGHSLGAFTILYAFFRNNQLSAKALVLLATPGTAEDFVQVYSEMLGLSKKAMGLISDHFVELYDHPPSYFNSKRFAEGLEIPSLIIHDENDKDAPFHYAGALDKVMVSSEVYFTKGLGHKLKSPKVVQKVIDYIEQY